MVVLLVQFVVKPGQEKRTQEIIRVMQEQTRKEPGCVQYSGHQSTEDPRRFFFYESYKDEEALQTHRNSAHFREHILGGLDNILADRRRELFVPVE
jgi:quinol monooxygenase YgiN